MTALRRAGDLATYTSEILEGPQGPQFKVTASDADKEFVDNTPAGVWNQVHTQVRWREHVVERLLGVACVLVAFWGRGGNTVLCADVRFGQMTVYTPSTLFVQINAIHPVGKSTPSTFELMGLAHPVISMLIQVCRGCLECMAPSCSMTASQ
jgi:hypothetical protein